MNAQSTKRIEAAIIELVAAIYEGRHAAPETLLRGLGLRLDSGVSVLRIADVMARTGIAKSTIYLRVQQGRFPKPVELGSSRCKGWIAAEIDEWITECADASRATS